MNSGPALRLPDLGELAPKAPQGMFPGAPGTWSGNAGNVYLISGAKTGRWQLRGGTDADLVVAQLLVVSTIPRMLRRAEFIPGGREPVPLSMSIRRATRMVPRERRAIEAARLGEVIKLMRSRPPAPASTTWPDDDESLDAQTGNRLDVEPIGSTPAGKKRRRRRLPRRPDYAGGDAADPPLIRSPVAADLLCISYRTFVDRIWAGKVPVRKIGGGRLRPRWAVPASWVKAQIQEQRQGLDPAAKGWQGRRYKKLLKQEHEAERAAIAAAEKGADE